MEKHNMINYIIIFVSFLYALFHFYVFSNFWGMCFVAKAICEQF